MNAIRWQCGLVAAVFASSLLAGSSIRAQDKKDKLELDQIPKAVMDALKVRFPKAEIQKWTKAKEGDDIVYDIEFIQKGRKGEADIKENGTYVNFELEIAASSGEAPKIRLVVEGAVVPGAPDPQRARRERLADQVAQVLHASRARLVSSEVADRVWTTWTAGRSPCPPAFQRLLVRLVDHRVRIDRVAAAAKAWDRTSPTEAFEAALGAVSRRIQILLHPNTARRCAQARSQRHQSTAEIAARTARSSKTTGAAEPSPSAARRHLIAERLFNPRGGNLIGNVDRDLLIDEGKRRLELHRELDSAFVATKLPDRPDYNRANALLLKARKFMVGE